MSSRSLGIRHRGEIERFSHDPPLYAKELSVQPAFPEVVKQAAGSKPKQPTSHQLNALLARSVWVEFDRIQACPCVVLRVLFNAAENYIALLDS